MAESNGLLDFAKSPAFMGLLAAGFGGLAGANKNTPWNNLGRAGLAGVAGYSAADALQQKQYKIDEQKRVQDLIPTFYKTGEDGSVTFDGVGAARAGIDPKLIQDYATVPKAGVAKVARTISVPGINGEKVTIQLDEYGNKIGEGQQSYVAPVQVNDGQTTRFVAPVAGTTIKQQLSPAQILADQRSRQSQAQSAANQPFMVVNGQTVPNPQYQQYQLDKAQKGATTINTGDNPQGYSDKPLPVGALKIQDEALGALGSAGTLDQILATQQKKIEDGKLKFGAVSNLKNEGLNASGFSSEESRNFASFKSDLERMRNESLRLNSGVQTDGDAQRAWNELFQNINDTDLVNQRLSEIRSINSRAAELQKLRVDGVRTNYNAAPYDFSKYESTPSGSAANNQNPPANPQQGGTQVGTVEDGYVFMGGDDTNPANWKKQ